MNKKYALALLMVICGCSSEDPHKDCNSRKCKAHTSEAPKPTVEQVAAPEIKLEEVKK
jgi:hypothetical protein